MDEHNDKSHDEIDAQKEQKEEKVKINIDEVSFLNDIERKMATKVGNNLISKIKENNVEKEKPVHKQLNKTDIEALILECCEQLNYKLIKFIMFRGKMEIIIDHNLTDNLEDPNFLECKNIILEDCEKLSQRFAALLEVNNPYLKSKYDIEITSPGINKKLSGTADFQRHITERISLTYDSDQDENTIHKQAFIIYADQDKIITYNKPELDQKLVKKYLKQHGLDIETKMEELSKDFPNIKLLMEKAEYVSLDSNIRDFFVAFLHQHQKDLAKTDANSHNSISSDSDDEYLVVYYDNIVSARLLPIL